MTVRTAAFGKAPYLAILLALAPACKERTASTVSASGNGNVKRLVFDNGQDYLVIEALRDDVLHFETAHGKAPSAGSALYHTPMVAKEDYPGPTRFAQRSDGFDTARLGVTVTAGTLCVEVTDKVLGQTLHTTCPTRLDQAWKGLEVNSPASRNVYGLGQYFTNAGTADGDWVGRVWDPGQESQGNELRGFSGGANGVTQVPVMYAMGQAGHQYALFLDQAYKLMWSFNAAPWKLDMWGDQIRWYVIGGDDVKSLRRSYMELTGRPPVPPKKAFGLFVSEFGYDDWAEVDDRLGSLERNAFPVDGFGLDLQWFGGTFYERGSDTRGSRMGTLQFDPKAFANAPQKVPDYLRKRGVGFLAIEESYVSKFLPEHAALDKQGFLVKDCNSGQAAYLDANPWWGVGGMIDWSNPKAGDWWFDNKRKPLVDMGVTMHWTDLGEPEMYHPNGCYFGFPALGKNRHGDVHNLYNFLWLESIARGYRRNGIAARPFMMSRSGAAGMQRFGAGMWSGDIGANMGALTAHFNAQMHMSMAGIDYYGSDVGGFHRRSDTLDGDPGELFTQWLANSAVFDTPVRSHVWNVKNNLVTNPAEIGDKASNLFNVRQRYALAPYYYSLAHEAFRQGDPLMPPLAYQFPEDMSVRKIGHQKMIGPWLMGAVVARYGETARDVYLPAGRWADFHTFRWYDSKGEQAKGVPNVQDKVFRVPLFARAGAIVPMAFVDDKTRNMLGLRKDGSRRDDLIVRVFPDARPSAFTLSEDDGETVAYQRGEVARTEIRQAARAGGVDVEIAPTVGTFANQATKRPYAVEVILDGQTPTGASVNGRALPACAANVTDASHDPNQACWRLAEPKRVVAYAGVMGIGEKKAVSVTFK